MINDKPYTFDRVVRISLSAGLLFGMIWVLGYLSDVLIPFFVAVLLAYLFNPLVTLIQEKVKNRAAAILVSMVLVAALALGAAMIIIPMIMDQIARMGGILSKLATDTEIARRFTEFLPSDIGRMIREYVAREEVQNFFKTSKFLVIVETAARKLLPGIWGLITGVTSLLMGIVGLSVIALYLIFLL
ncbi:MAG: AI-2E family transporter, partial [Desulfobacterales bacterium]|nr:AI-2E family transporter [Desulfobacterales bacterium]